MKNVFLLGYMGSGKSTIGKKLANKLNLNFIDLDSFIEEKYNTTISVIFSEKGESEFRKLEREALITVSQNINTIVSLGGGTPCFYDNMDIIKHSGFSIYLKMPVGMLVSRLINAKVKRPLIQEMNKEELFQFVEQQLSEREKYYLKSDISVDGSKLKINQIVELIISQ